MTSETFRREWCCGPPSDSCRLLWACARWLMTPLKRCLCQSSTFIRPQNLVIVIPQREKKVGRWVQVGADVSKRSQRTERKRSNYLSVVGWHVKDLETCGMEVHGGLQSNAAWPALLPLLSKQILWLALLSRTTGSRCVTTLLSEALNRCGSVWSALAVVEQGRS